MNPWQPYVQPIERLPFVRSFAVEGEVAVLATPTRAFRLALDVRKSHLTHEVSRWLIGDAERRPTGSLVLAPHIGGDIAEAFVDKGVSFVDLRGNCFIQLGERYIARISGRAPPKQAPKPKGIRKPGFWALFALLADRKLLDAPLRAQAERAGVSRTSMADIRARLLDRGWLVPHGGSFAFSTNGAEAARDFWLSGYALTVRASAELGRFRFVDSRVRTFGDAMAGNRPVRTPDLAALETFVKRRMPKGIDFGFGGEGAAHLVIDTPTSGRRGPSPSRRVESALRRATKSARRNTVAAGASRRQAALELGRVAPLSVVVSEAWQDAAEFAGGVDALTRKLELASDPEGPIRLVQVPGSAVFDGAGPLVHPLFVQTELALQTGSGEP
jgi:hypothetical protein